MLGKDSFNEIIVKRKIIFFVKNNKMKHLISVNYPESLALSLKMNNREFEQEMKTISLIKLYELGKYRLDLLQNF